MGPDKILGVLIHIAYLSIALSWLVLLVSTLRLVAGAPRVFPQQGCHDRADRPLVSLLVPARNEGDRVLVESICSMLKQDYPNFEVIVVDDCSTDNTREVLNELMAKDRRLRVIAGKQPPRGWTGKVYALHQARAEARGELLLATDADIVFHPEAVATAVQILQRNRLDAITLYPSVELGSFWERLLLPEIAWMLFIQSPFHKANDTEADTALGCGGFLLMRRHAHDAIGGYEAIKGEINEDSWTMRLMKRRGLRTLAADGGMLVHTRMYRSLGEIWEGFGKNMFPAVGSRCLRAAKVVAFDMAITLLPLAGILSESSLNFYLSLAAIACMLGTSAIFRQRMRAPIRYAPLSPLGHIVAMMIMTTSALRIISGSGVPWRGRRVYPNTI